jgi:glycosyltransferase involved in cell wall biosynthesis
VKVCLVGQYDIDHPKEAIIRRSLRSAGVEVVDCLAKKEILGQGLRKLPALPGVARDIWKQIRAADCDAIIVAHGNNILVPFLRMQSKGQRTPIILDGFDPQYIHAMLRGEPWLKTRLVWLVEKLSFVASDKIIVVADAMRDVYIDTYGVSSDKLVVVPCGADEAKWYNNGQASSESPADFRIVYWGRFHAHHGISVILEAAQQLESERVEFVVAGDGRGRDELVESARGKGVGNIKFPGFLSDQELRALVVSADVCLGFLSEDTPAQNSISWKVSEALAMSKAVITVRSPATQETFIHRENIYMIPAGSGSALAEGILEIKEDGSLRNRLERNGNAYYRDHYSQEALGRSLRGIIEMSISDDLQTQRDQ